MAAPARAATSVAIATVRCSYVFQYSVKIVPWRLAVEDYAYTGYVAYCRMFIIHFLAYNYKKCGSATLIRLHISLQMYMYVIQLHDIVHVYVHSVCMTLQCTRKMYMCETYHVHCAASYMYLGFGLLSWFSCTVYAICMQRMNES